MNSEFVETEKSHDDLMDLTEEILNGMGFKEIDDVRIAGKERDRNRVTAYARDGSLIPDLTATLNGKKYYVECGLTSSGKIVRYLENGLSVIHVPYPERNNCGLTIHKVVVYSLGDSAEYLSQRLYDLERLEERANRLEKEIRQVLNVKQAEQRVMKDVDNQTQQQVKEGSE